MIVSPEMSRKIADYYRSIGDVENLNKQLVSIRTAEAASKALSQEPSFSKNASSLNDNVVGGILIGIIALPILYCMSLAMKRNFP